MTPITTKFSEHYEVHPPFYPHQDGVFLKIKWEASQIPLYRVSKLYHTNVIAI